MTPDTLLARINSEPDASVTRMVREVSPLILMQARQPSGLQFKDLLAAPASSSERVFRYGHRLGPPVAQSDIDRWQELHQLTLPGDLQEVLRQFDGIHLWANVETGRAYLGVAPLDEWEPARTKIYGASAAPAWLDDRFVAISYNQDAAAFLVLDVRSSVYFLMDAAGPDTSSPVAQSASEMLDWVWESRVLPK